MRGAKLNVAPRAVHYMNGGTSADGWYNMTIKQDRIAERIREIMSSLLLFEVTDPALQDLTVTDVRIDRELEYADIYVNALGDETRQNEVMAGLARANGFLRREVGKRLRLRRVPVLKFHWDMNFSHAEAVHQKLAQLHIPPAPIEEPTEDNSSDELE